MTMALAEGYSMIGLMLAKMRGPHWAFSREECAKLGLSSANVIRHMPVPVEQLGIGMDIAMLGVAVVGVATPRVMYDQALAENARQQENRAAADTADEYIKMRQRGSENAMGSNFKSYTPPPANGNRPQPPPITPQNETPPV